MIKFLFLLLKGSGFSLFLLLLSGCATNPIAEPAFAFDREKPPCPHLSVSVPVPATHPAKVTHHKKAYRLAYGNDPASEQAQAFRRYAKTGKAPHLITDGFVTALYQAEQQPIIQTAPFQETVIRLEPGEKFTNISSGDPSRWSYAVAVSGKGETEQQNILVKPSLPDISTNLVVTTDKRLYNLRLVASQTDSPTRSVNFWYPEDLMKARCDTPSSLAEEPMEAACRRPPLHCDYRITTAGFFSRPPAWQPVRVFDDGAHTTIEFPDNITNRDLPTLFVVNEGQKECVNYRFTSPDMIVDKIFSEATLVSGVGRSQQAVMLTNLCY